MDINFEQKAKETLKSFLKEKNITYSEIAEKLYSIGIEENPINLANKVNRGTFSFSLVLQIFEALDLKFSLESKDENKELKEIKAIQEALQKELWYVNADILEEYLAQTPITLSEENTYKGRKIMEWLKQQITLSCENKLSPEQCARLDEIIPIISISNDSNLQWNIKANSLKQYIETNGCLPKQSTTFAGVKLGSWLTNQRYAYKNGQLSDERISVLRDIDESVLLDREKSLEAQWLENANLLREYVNKNNELPKTTTIYKDVNIGIWLNAQKATLRKEQLSKERIDILLNIDKDIFKTKEEIDNERWLENAELLREYVNENNELPKYATIYKDVKIGSWLSSQKKYYKTNDLSQERIDKLLSISPEVFGEMIDER